MDNNVKEEIEQRKEKVKGYLKKYNDWLIYLMVFIIISVGVWIRTLNIHLLRDVTNGQYIPSDPDAMGFLRYVEYALEHGKLMAVDTIRYFGHGYTNLQDFSLLSNFIVYIYKVMHWLIPDVTIQYVHIIYPPICFAIGMFFFYLFVKKVFDWRIALIATAFLTVIPSFLFRTMAGVSDKEAFAVMMLFIFLYFYISSFKAYTLQKTIMFSILAAVSTALMGLVWGGVSFVFLTIGLFTLILIILDLINNKNIYGYFVWVGVTFAILASFYYYRFNPISLIYSNTMMPLTLALVSGIFLLGIKRFNIKLKKDVPKGILAVLISVIFGGIALLILRGPSYFMERLPDIFIDMVAPFGRSRWALTVAESHQPYIANWVAEMGWGYIYAFLAGAIFLFYCMVEHFGKKRAMPLMSMFALFLFCFTMNRYSQNSILNGVSGVSVVMYVGSIVLLLGGVIYLYLKTYYKDENLLKLIKKINPIFIFILIWFIVMIIGARSALRLIFVFAPVTTILVAFGIIKSIDIILGWKDKTKYLFIVFIILISLVTYFNFEKQVISTARGIGPSSYNQQWQVAMAWVMDNTKVDSVFTQWWDYGYSIQYGGKRATLSDGGNAYGGINHLVGRHFLTNSNDEDVLMFLQANKVTHTLISSAEIFKYPAYSSIGSGAGEQCNDRLSWITTFNLDPQQITETRNSTIYVWVGGMMLDEDFIYNKKVFTKDSTGISAVIMPISLLTGEIEQPSVVLVNNNQAYHIPLNCVIVGAVNAPKFSFDNKEGYDGCFQIIPKFENGDINPLGSGFLLSKKVKDTFFAKYYLFGWESPYFKIVYDDSINWPLLNYQGTLIGPLKIWDVDYPIGLSQGPKYYSTWETSPAVDRLC